MTPNPIRELWQNRLGTTRDEFAKRVGRSASTLERFDSDPTPDLLRELARVADEEGHHDLALLFRRQAGDAPPAELDLEDITTAERDVLLNALRVLRDPDMSLNFPELVRRLAAGCAPQGNKKPRPR